MKKLFFAVLSVAVIGFCIYSFLTSDLEEIPDQNGPDDTSLVVITDQDIIADEMGAMHPISITSGWFINGLEFSSENFTGVHQILYDNFIFESDFVLDLRNLEVTEGNFKMAVVHNDEIVATIEPGASIHYVLENVEGSVYLRIAGESASYSFMMYESDYDMHSHS